ncbi:MAG: acetate kinase [Luteolibacter sp.]|uniref:acetate/propionate family kinase n=1 Tax=Luteolibacter sp. TaxID=1962973 RepID=UPI00326713F1
MQTPSSTGADCVIVINCGSSSLKLAVLPAEGETVLLKGLAERLGGPDATLTVEKDGETTVTSIPSASHHEALQATVRSMDGLTPRGIGHRVVHGGEEFTASALIDDGVMEAVERCASLAPLHNPANLTGIRTARSLFPGLPQVAVFDTAFHQTLPPKAFHYAIPHSYYEDLKVRRYGFHGTSHHYVSLEAARMLGKRAEETSLITLHIGNGCSGCAIRDGRSVDTTMGLTPSEGLVMGTRSGDVDPALHQFLQDQTGMRLGEITAMLNSRSGLLGLSGLSNDMRTLSDAARNGHQRAALAIEVFCYRLAKSTAGLMAALERIDAVVFTGGIGENSAEIRAATAAHLAIFGIHLDDAKNSAHANLISSTNSRIPCLVVPTNEELMIARETLRLTS